MGNILKTYHYELGKIERGYSGRSLYINVSDLSIQEKSSQTS